MIDDIFLKYKYKNQIPNDLNFLIAFKLLFIAYLALLWSKLVSLQIAIVFSTFYILNYGLIGLAGGEMGSLSSS